MNKKILKRYTNIPEHLYVFRSADDQLKMIIEDMQRPGYVLVARQMGKTNLLLNAKRNLESKYRLFTYVDLSNVFDTERECYRNIIDHIVETNEELFIEANKEIVDIRSQFIAPHKEYSRSLRKLLTFYEGDIVIILDEIDALRGSEYSDNIFAQIRSNYFSRTNFSEFERVTYILSGVIEPTQLIKDRNKSPFNIGEKIYLNDFTFSEYSDFVIKSKLQLDSEVTNEIYNWTKGNPRLTFDILSDIEDVILEKRSISISEVVMLIKNKYLKTYDIPPIDHIRELVRSNKQIRKSVVLLHRKKGNEIPDEVKSKLYLYGITSSLSDEEVRIKNPIIANSISMNWIKSVDELVTDTFSLGLEKVDTKEFQQAIEYLKNYIGNSSPSKTHVEICNYNIGFSYYRLRKLDEAAKYFSAPFESEIYARNSKSLLGVCKIGIGESEEGVQILEEILADDSRDFAYRNAALNLAPIISKVDPNRALIIYDELLLSLIDGVDSNDLDYAQIDIFKCLIYYYKSEIYKRQSKSDLVIENIDLAIQHSSKTDSIYLNYCKAKIINPQINDFHFIEDIITYNYEFEKENSYEFSFKTNHLFIYLQELFSAGEIELFDKLLNYSQHELLKRHLSKAEIIYAASLTSNIRKVELLERVIFEDSGRDDNLSLSVYRDLALASISEKTNFSKYFGQYRILLSKHLQIESSDILLFATAIRYNSDKRSIQAAIDLCDEIIEKVELQDNKTLEYESVIIYYWYTNLYFERKKSEEVLKYGDKTLNLIDRYKGFDNSVIDEKGMEIIRENIKLIKNSTISRTPIRSKKKYGRNEKIKVKYTDGKIVEGKYKKLEADIIAKRCEILNAT